MDQDHIIKLAEQLVSGSLDIPQFVECLGENSSVEMGDVTLDLGRDQRCGFPEVVFGQGKTIESLRKIFSRLIEAGQPVLATRIDQQQAESLLADFPEAQYNSLARTVRLPDQAGSPLGNVAIVTAGTSDRPVAEEAYETLRWMNVEVSMIYDVGVAGPHRLPAKIETLRHADVVVVVAGMEGALPSVVGGYVACPVIGVPPSVGYGASLGGMAALLSMLNSCAANVTVVNIDAGFKAAYVAGMIATQKHRAPDSSDG
jgi:hypothetical protein